MREYNKKCINFGLTGLIETPYNAGFTPTGYSVTANDSIIQISEDNILLIDGGDLLLI